VLKYDKDLNLLATLDQPKDIKEGWGLACDDEFLYISSGNNKIYVV